MSSTEQQPKYREVSTFELDEGNRSLNNIHSQTRRMEPIKKSRQFITGVIVNLSSVAVGTCLGWTSPVNSKLIDSVDGYPLKVPVENNSDELAWIGSLVAIGALVAPFIAGPLADKIGRKYTLLSSSIFFVVAYVLMLIAGNVEILYAARLIQGFGVGFVMTAQPMYIGEISTDDCRGALGSFMQLFIVTGILYVYAIGPYVGYQALQWTCIVIPIIFAVAFFFMPESPYYFVGKGRKFDAIKSLQFLRGQSSDGVQDEMASIQASVEEAQAKKGSFTDIIKNKCYLKALIISAGLISFQQLSGINVVLFNSQSIFEDANTGLDPAIATILVGIVQVISSGVTPLIADRLGRKIILLTSALFMCIGLIALGAFFYMKTQGDVSNISWLPVTSLILYVIVYCIGFGPLPWAVLGEMFPANVKSIASSIVASTCWILGFLVTRFYPNLNSLGTHVVFWLFGSFCAIAFAFVYFIVMETKGLSLQQIQDKLSGK